MLRREVIKLGSLFGLGAGTPSRFPYPDRPQSSAGLGPSSAASVRARTIIIFGPAGAVEGLFMYAAGTIPGPGNPPVVWISESTTDPFGNSLVTPPSGAAWAALTSAALEFAAANATGTYTGSVVFDFIGASLAQKLHFLATRTAGASAGFALVPGTGVLQVDQGTVITATDPAGAGTAETWHTVGAPGEPAFAAGFGAPGAGDQTLRFRLMADNTVQLDGVTVTTAATAANATIFTLAAAYRPQQRKRFAGDTNASGYVTPGQSLVQVLSTGVVSCVPACSGANQVVIADGMRYPVD